MIKPAKKMQLIEKHAKNLVDLGGPYEELRGIHHAEDGSVYATNRFLAVRMKAVHAHKGPVTFHALTGEKIKKEYPLRQLEQAFSSEYDTGFRILGEDRIEEITRLVRLIKEICELYNPPDLMTLFSQYSNVILHTQAEGMQFTARFADYDDKREIRMCLNPRYLYTALSFFRDAGSSELRFRFKEEQRAPVMISDPDNWIDFIILPLLRPR